MTFSNRKGYRGYMGARMEMGRSTPQHIQQLVMRDYCAKRSMDYLLAGVEYRMEGCTMMLDGILEELDSIEGIVMYSLYQLPVSREKRMALYKRLFDKGCSLHLAAEGIAVESPEDAARIEESWLVMEAMRGQNIESLAYLAEWDSASKAKHM